MDVGNLFLGIESLVPSVVRALRGTVVRGHRRRPNKLLELYDAEYSPRCRYIRETLTELTLGQDRNVRPGNGAARPSGCVRPG